MNTAELETLIRTILSEKLAPTPPAPQQEQGIFCDVGSAIDAAHQAFLRYQQCPLKTRSAIISALRETLAPELATLAEESATETGMGNKEDKYLKWESYTGKYVLVVTSTTGQGDLPDSIVPLYEGIKDMYQPHLRYGIIALGDSTYANFCGGGLKFDQLLQEQGAKRIGEMLKIDASEDPEPESVSNPWVEQWATLLA
ncbi:TPA: flavodoxin [Klebsiella pneumoniae]